MTTVLTLFALFLLLGALARYARRDHFAGTGSLPEAHDEFGSLHTRDHLVPRRF